MEIKEVVKKALDYKDLMDKFGEERKDLLSPKASVLGQYCRWYYCPMCDSRGRFEGAVEALLHPYGLSFWDIRTEVSCLARDTCAVGPYLVDGLIRIMDGENMDVLAEKRERELKDAISESVLQLKEERKKLISEWRGRFEKKILEIGDDFNLRMKELEEKEIVQDRVRLLRHYGPGYKKEVKIEFEL